MKIYWNYLGGTCAWDWDWDGGTDLGQMGWRKNVGQLGKPAMNH